MSYVRLGIWRVLNAPNDFEWTFQNPSSYLASALLMQICWPCKNESYMGLDPQEMGKRPSKPDASYITTTLKYYVHVLIITCFRRVGVLVLCRQIS